MEEIEDFITALPIDERLIVKKLRQIILEAEPCLQEKLSYGVPYFSRHRRICFLWPVSHFPSGFKAEKSVKVTFGLCYGNHLSNTQNVLELGKRKQVSIIQYTTLREVDERVVQEIIHEAVLIDEQFHPKKKSKMK